MAEPQKQPQLPLSNQPKAPLSEVEQLKAEIAALTAKLESVPGAAIPAPVPPVREKTSGTFRLTERFYRLSRMYEPGETITIKDEVPGRSWERIDPNAPAPAAETPAPHGHGHGRPNDRTL